MLSYTVTLPPLRHPSSSTQVPNPEPHSPPGALWLERIVTGSSGRLSRP